MTLHLGHFVSQQKLWDWIFLCDFLSFPELSGLTWEPLPKSGLYLLFFFFFFLVCRFPLHLEKSVGCGNYSDYGCLCIFKGFRFQLVTHKKRVVWIQYTCTRYGHWAGVTIRSSLLCPYLVHVYWIQTTRFLWVTNWNRKPLNMHRHP